MGRRGRRWKVSQLRGREVNEGGTGIGEGGKEAKVMERVGEDKKLC